MLRLQDSGMMRTKYLISFPPKIKIPTDITAIHIPGDKYMQALEIASHIRKTRGFILHINNILRIKI